MIVYEYPFNERTRTFLRLERLFLRLQTLILRDSDVDHHSAVLTLFEILDVGGRAELKTEAIKELERHKQQFNAYRGNPAISEQVLDSYIDQIDQLLAPLHESTTRPGAALQECEWLMAVRSRIGIPGGTCEFDLPAYHHWLQSAAERRQAQLLAWAQSFAPLAQGIHWLLKVSRQSGNPQKVAVIHGHYQQSLPQGRTFAMMQVRLPKALDCVPEISGNRLLFAIRLMRIGENGRLQHQSDLDTSLEITLCS